MLRNPQASLSPAHLPFAQCPIRRSTRRRRFPRRRGRPRRAGQKSGQRSWARRVQSETPATLMLPNTAARPPRSERNPGESRKRRANVPKTARNTLTLRPPAIATPARVSGEDPGSSQPSGSSDLLFARLSARVVSDILFLTSFGVGASAGRKGRRRRNIRPRRLPPCAQPGSLLTLGGGPPRAAGRLSGRLGAPRRPRRSGPKPQKQ